MTDKKGMYLHWMCAITGRRHIADTALIFPTDIFRSKNLYDLKTQMGENSKSCEQ